MATSTSSGLVAVVASASRVAAAAAAGSASKSRASMSNATRRRLSSAPSRAVARGSWVEEDTRRMLHVVYRVGDMQKTIDYYTKFFGMHVTRQRDIPEDKYSNAFLAYGPEETNFAIELTYNYGVDSYDLGGGFGHMGICTPNVKEMADKIKQGGGKITRDAGPVKGGSTVIAFAEDPDGYKFEIIEREKMVEPLCQVMLRVGDLPKSMEYYEKCLGMKAIRTRDNPEYNYTLGFMGYGPEDESCVLELTYNYGVETYDMGNAYGQIAISTKDVYKTAEAIKQAGGKVTREPGPVPGIGTKICATVDPNGWKTVFVDEEDFMRELEE